MGCRAATAVPTVLVGLLLLAGCGDDHADADPTSTDPSGQTGSSEPEVTDQVSLTLTEDAGAVVLSGAGNSGSALVLLPLGEPDRSENDTGVTLTYVRQEADDDDVGDEPTLYEAARLSDGTAKELDRPSFASEPVTVRYCLEVVPEDDVAAPADDGAFRVTGPDPSASPLVACSDYTTLEGR